jgi:hypothetical protein
LYDGIAVLGSATTKLQAATDAAAYVAVAQGNECTSIRMQAAVQAAHAAMNPAVPLAPQAAAALSAVAATAVAALTGQHAAAAGPDVEPVDSGLYDLD